MLDLSVSEDSVRLSTGLAASVDRLQQVFNIQRSGISAMASRGRRGGAPAREDEPRHEERAEQQAPAPQGPILPPLPPVDYGVFMQGLVQAMQTQAHTQAALRLSWRLRLA
ncbi:hypothetical protein Taro_014716 [Colocasia esculenta]|uniref:Uncharacterized protein n=1 Tax=Colocasia esculenta TaxID=4460 RepID=A0A843UR06_COLES|nr:hypothetical protein [Colocasia esculenta]